MKYIVFAYGQYENSQKLVKKIVEQLVPISRDTNLKYSYGDQSMIVLLDSDIEFEIIKKYVTFIFNQYSSMYFIMPCTDKMSYNIPQDMMDLFFGQDENMISKMAENVDEDQIDEIFSQFSENDLEDIYEEEDTLEQILKQSKQTKKTEVLPSLDDILDKISANGVSSLNEKERQVLDSYSKQ